MEEPENGMAMKIGDNSQRYIANKIKKIAYDEFGGLSNLLLKYRREPLSTFQSYVHHLCGVTTAGIKLHMNTGLHKLLYLRAKGDPLEEDAMKYLNADTLTLGELPNLGGKEFDNLKDQPGFRLLTVLSSKTFVFAAALKFFIQKYMEDPFVNFHPDIFCKINLFLTASDEKTMICRGFRVVELLDMKANTFQTGIIPPECRWNLSDRCQCKVGVHSWLDKFIRQINNKNLRAAKWNPMYEIAHFYLRFIARNCFGKRTRQIGMILLQALTIKWVHHMVLPFNENEERFRKIMTKASDMPINALTSFLEQVLAENVNDILIRSCGKSVSLDGSNNDSSAGTNKSQAEVISTSSHGGSSNATSDMDIFDLEMPFRIVSTDLEPVLALQTQSSQDSLHEQDFVERITSPYLQIEIPRTDEPCRGRPAGKRPLPTPRQKHACHHRSGPCVWSDMCNDCDLELVKEVLPVQWTPAPSREPTPETTPKLTPDKGSPICESPDLIGEYHICGFEVGSSVSDEKSAVSTLLRPPLPDKREPVKEEYRCTQCGRYMVKENLLCAKCESEILPPSEEPHLSHERERGALRGDDVIDEQDRGRDSTIRRRREKSPSPIWFAHIEYSESEEHVFPISMSKYITNARDRRMRSISRDWEQTERIRNNRFKFPLLMFIICLTSHLKYLDTWDASSCCMCKDDAESLLRSEDDITQWPLALPWTGMRSLLGLRMGSAVCKEENTEADKVDGKWMWEGVD